MFSSNSNPCASYLSSSSNQYYSRPANCYRPLQQLYKTVNSSCDCDKTLSSSSRTAAAAAGKAGPMQIACICRPAERYKTTNMTYGSFYYENSLSTEKNQVINYDKAIFARCYDQNKINMANTSTKDKNCTKDSIFSHGMDPMERQYWTSSTSDACCPIDCCHNTTIFCPDKVSTPNDQCLDV